MDNQEDSNKMRAVAYIRVSSEEQVHGTSLDSQEKACRKYAVEHDYILEKPDIFREEGVSATLIDRPKLTELIAYCSKNKGKIHACIVWKVDRLARKSEYHHVIKAQLAKLGVKLVSVTEPIGDDPIGNLMESVLAGFAQFDNDIRTARSTAGMRERTKQGGWPHAAPYGYKKGRTAAGVTYLVPDEEEAPIMTALLEKFAVGNYTVKQAADLAYKMGIRNKRGGKRGWESVKYLLVNPVYAGYIRTKFTDGETIKGLHEPLIDEKTHYRILAIVSGDLKKYSKQAEFDWPLRGGFLKHTCGHASTGSAPTGRNGPSPRYHCTKCKSSKDLHTSKRREIVHGDFVDLLSKIKPDEPTQKLFKEIALRRWNTDFKDAIEHNGRLNDAIGACQQKKSRIIDLFIDGKLDDTEKKNKLAEVDTELARLKLQSVEADKYITQKEAIIDGAMLFMANAGAFWNLVNIEVKKRIQDAIFPDGVVYDFDVGFGTAKLAESYRLMAEITASEAENPSLAPTTRLNTQPNI